jgi:hypothetical protein
MLPMTLALLCLSAILLVLGLLAIFSQFGTF